MGAVSDDEHALGRDLDDAEPRIEVVELVDPARRVARRGSVAPWPARPTDGLRPRPGDATERTRVDCAAAFANAARLPITPHLPLHREPRAPRASPLAVRSVPFVLPAGSTSARTRALPLTSHRQRRHVADHPGAAVGSVAPASRASPTGPCDTTSRSCWTIHPARECRGVVAAHAHVMADAIAAAHASGPEHRPRSAGPPR